MNKYANAANKMFLKFNILSTLINQNRSGCSLLDVGVVLLG